MKVVQDFVQFFMFVAIVIAGILLYRAYVEPKINGGVVYPAVQPAVQPTQFVQPAAVVAPIVQPAPQVANPAPQIVNPEPVIIPSPTVLAEPTPIYIVTCQETTVYGVPVEVNYTVVWSLPANFPILIEEYNGDMTWAKLSPMTTGRQEEMWITTRSITVCP